MENNAHFRKLARDGYLRFRRRRFQEATALGLSVLLPGLLLAVGLGMALRYQAASAWAGPLVALGAFGTAAGLAFRYGLRHRLTYEEHLRKVESLVGLRGNELVNADELEARLATIDDPLSRGLAAQAIDAGIARVRQVPFEQLAPSMKLTGPAWRGLGAVGLGVAAFLFLPDAFESGVARLLRPGTRDVPVAARIVVEPGDVTLQRGDPLDVTAVVPAEAEGAQLFWRSEGGPWRSVEMRVTDAGSEGQTFAATLRGVMEDAEYAVATDAARSETYAIEMTEPLRALGYRKRVTPPAYTGIAPSEEMAADGNVSAVFGSELRLSVQTGRERTEGELVWEDGATSSLRGADGEVMFAELRVEEERGFRVRLTTPDLPGKEWISRPFRIVPVPDRHPTLNQLAPESRVDLPPEMVVELDLDCVDDFGLRQLDLVYQRNEHAPERVRITSWSSEREARVVHPWDLEGIALVPGDVIRYHLELSDNDVISGPKVSRGPECEVRFPTLEELYAEVQEDRGEQMGDVSDLKEQQEEIREELERALTDLKRSDELDWEQQEALKDLAKKQEEVEKKLEDLTESLDQSLEKMEQGELFSPEMQKKVEEINELSRQIQDPAFRQQMEELKKALEKLDKDAVEQSLEQMQLSQKELEQSLDRTLELLKRLKNEETLDQIVQESQRLVEEQRKLNEKLADRLDPQAGEKKATEKEELDERESGEKESGEKESGEKESGENEADDAKEGEEQESADEGTEPKDEQADSPKGDQPSGDQAKAEEPGDELTPEERAALQAKQEELRKELEELEKKLAELTQEAEKNWEELSEEMKKDEPQKQLDSAQQSMGQSSQQMPKSPKESMQFGRKAEQELQQFSQQMQQAQQAVAQQEQEDITRQLFHISGELVAVSDDQEGLLGEAPSQPTRDLAAEQARIAQSARQTLDDLNELGRRSQLLSPDLTRAMNGAVRALEGSTKAFERGNRQGAMAEGKSSTNTLNQTVIELLEANDQMCNNPSSGSCNNPMSRMRSLSAQQQELNSDTRAGQGGQPQGERLQPQGGQGSPQSLEQLAARQEMIRRGLAELQGELGDRRDMLGRLDELAEDMGEVVEEMQEKGEIDERILERQEKILSRLLTAQKSIRREDEKETRVSRTGENPTDREAPPPVAEELGRKERLERGILRGSQDPIPDEFRRLVEDYYQSLARE